MTEFNERGNPDGLPIHFRYRLNKKPGRFERIEPIIGHCVVVDLDPVGVTPISAESDPGVDAVARLLSEARESDSSSAA